MLFRSSVIQETHGFDLDYHMYVEEIDWCIRVKKAGWGIYCVPGAEIVHLEGQSTSQVRPEMIVALWRSRYILFGKHYSPVYQWLVTRIIRAGMRGKIRRLCQSIEGGQVDAAAAGRLIDAYKQVLAMRA
jgi:GT2 family glycosyltransferase